MPMRAPSPCLDCGTPTANPRCPDHTRTYHRATHDPTRKAVYATPQWRATRRRVLARDVWCQAPGCTNPGHDVDHVIPLGQVDDPYDETNLQALCRRHHSQKTAREVWGRK